MCESAATTTATGGYSYVSASLANNGGHTASFATASGSLSGTAS